MEGGVGVGWGEDGGRGWKVGVGVAVEMGVGVLQGLGLWGAQSLVYGLHKIL